MSIKLYCYVNFACVNLSIKNYNIFILLYMTNFAKISIKKICPTLFRSTFSTVGKLFETGYQSTQVSLIKTGPTFDGRTVANKERAT